MTIVNKCFILFSLLICSSRTIAQQGEFNAWFFSIHTQSISSKWKIVSDVQLRSAQKGRYLETIILRPAIQYNFSQSHRVAVGYGYIGKRADTESPLLPEHRIFEQYITEARGRKATFTHRLRAEQRFLRTVGKYDFTQRLRSFAHLKIPFVSKKPFTRGAFAVLQNEIFLNVQHKDRANKSIFDQNRSYSSVGYRFSKHADAEIGYMFCYQKLAAADRRDHILQIVVTTSL